MQYECGILNVDTKRNVMLLSTWIRLLYMVLFVVILSGAMLVLKVAVVVQFLFRLVRGSEIARLSQFGVGLGNYFRAIILYLTYHTDEMPYPFGEWPTDNNYGDGLGEIGNNR